MKTYSYKNIILFFIYLSLCCADTIVPTPNAGDDISELVTSCIDKNIVIPVSGSLSANSALGACDTGVCSNPIKYCTTSDDEATSETCNSFVSCNEIKVCVGGSNENADCTIGECTDCDGNIDQITESACCEQNGGVWNDDYSICAGLGECIGCDGTITDQITESACCEQNEGIWDDIENDCNDIDGNDIGFCFDLETEGVEEQGWLSYDYEGCWNDNNFVGSDICGGDGVCQFPGECLSKYFYEDCCEAAGGEWASEYQFIAENECEELHGLSNSYWYNFSLEFDWSSSSEDLAISNSDNMNTNIIFDPLSSSEVQQYEIYLTVRNEFKYFDDDELIPSDSDTLLINLDPQLPCAVAGDDMYICRACGDENSGLYNSNYVSNVLSLMQFDADSSYSNGGDDFSYSWTTPAGFSLSALDVSGPTIAMDYAAAKNVVNIFTLEVIDNSNTDLVSVLDTVIIYMNPSRPDPPKVEVYPENDKITLNWERNASTTSIDSLTGYSDFEGYRIYKSIDGGDTWGSADDRIYYNGEHVGWRHEDQSDLSQEQDEKFCIKGIDIDIIGEGLDFSTLDDCLEYNDSNSEYCCIDNLVRDISISNLDPYAPWVNLGNDSGLKFSYIDTSVYNGKEYTYAVVAYDIGLQTYTDEPSATGVGICEPCDSSGSESAVSAQACCLSNDGAWGNDDICANSCDGDGHAWTPTYTSIETWSNTNPNHLTYDGINGFQSLESDLVESINVITAIPAFYAQNVKNISNFIDLNDFGIPAEDKLWKAVENTAVGNGGVYFQIINPYDITDERYQFEVTADYAGSDVEIFEGYKTENPVLYAWEINSDSSAVNLDYSITSIDQLTHDEKCELLSLPGSNIEGICSRSTLICEGGSKDGRECTYKDEGYCTNGECIESIANYLEDYYSCVCDDILADLAGASGALNGLASSYNDWLFGGDTIFYPVYEIEDFSIKYLYEDGYNENYTDFMDGLKFIFNNNVEKDSDLEDGKVIVKTQKSFNKDNQETSLSDYIDVALEYGNGGSVFDNKPSYSYRIEFSDKPTYESSGDPAVTPSSGCSGNRPNTLLPFKVINTTTDKEVGITHVDKGGFYDESGEYNAYGTCVEDGNPCSVDEYCYVNQCVELKGFGDCTWEKNERTSFTADTIHVGLTTRETAEYTFDLKVDYRVFALYAQGISPDQVDNWVLGSVYSTYDVVKYNDMFWNATGAPDPMTSPVEWVDDGSGNNINAWSPVYPWDDGDYIIIEPTRWYVDGDSWIADLSELGKSGNVTKESLKAISVVPNPYIVNSEYDETSSSRRMWFNHLPNKCRITIYTISGERVISMLHDDDILSGKESWDLRSKGGDLVAPGLYIYTVESEDSREKYIKHVSKFAIVR